MNNVKELNCVLSGRFSASVIVLPGDISIAIGPNNQAIRFATEKDIRIAGDDEPAIGSLNRAMRGCRVLSIRPRAAITARRKDIAVAIDVHQQEYPLERNIQLLSGA